MIARMGILFFSDKKTRTNSQERFPNYRRFKLEMGTSGREEQHPAPNSSRARVAGSGWSQGTPTASRGRVDHSHFSFTVTAGQAIKSK